MSETKKTHTHVHMQNKLKPLYTVCSHNKINATKLKKYNQCSSHLKLVNYCLMSIDMVSMENYVLMLNLQCAIPENIQNCIFLPMYDSFVYYKKGPYQCSRTSLQNTCMHSC